MEPLPRHWRDRFHAMAAMVAGWSKDPSSRIGAVIVSPDRRQIAVGYNGFPAGMPDDERLQDRDSKYPRVLHAEHNAVLNAQFPVTGCHLVVTAPPCQHCASVIIQSRIGAVYCPPVSADMADRWGRNFAEAEADMRACGVMVVKLWETGR